MTETKCDIREEVKRWALSLETANPFLKVSAEVHSMIGNVTHMLQVVVEAKDKDKSRLFITINQPINSKELSLVHDGKEYTLRMLDRAEQAIYRKVFCLAFGENTERVSNY